MLAARACELVPSQAPVACSICYEPGGSGICRYPSFDLTSRLLVKPADLSFENPCASPWPISEKQDDDAMYYAPVVQGSAHTALRPLHSYPEQDAKQMYSGWPAAKPNNSSVDYVPIHTGHSGGDVTYLSKAQRVILTPPGCSNKKD